MSLTFQCGECGRQYTVPDQYAGRWVRCKHCESTLEVPGPAAQAILAEPVAEEPVRPVASEHATAASQPALQPLRPTPIRPSGRRRVSTDGGLDTRMVALAVGAVGVVIVMVVLMMVVVFSGGSKDDIETARRPTPSQKGATSKDGRDAKVVPSAIEGGFPVKESVPVQEGLFVTEGFSVDESASSEPSPTVEASSQVEETLPAEEGFFVESSPPVKASPPTKESSPQANAGFNAPSTPTRPPSTSKKSVRAHVHLKIVSYPSGNADLLARKALEPVIWVEPNAIRVDRSANEIVIGIRVMAVNTHDAKLRLERVGFAIGGASFKPVRD